MSRSPRKSLRTAALALDQFLAVIDEHPDARQEVVERISEDGVRELDSIRQRVRHLADQLTGDDAS